MTRVRHVLAVAAALAAGVALAAHDARSNDSPTPLPEFKRKPFTADEAGQTVRPTYPTQPRTAQARQVPTVQTPQGVYCWPVYNGADVQSFQCNTGYWYTVMPDGTVQTGNGMADPGATARGSTIVIDPATGGPSLKGPTVTAPPTGLIPTPAPYQGPMYGYPLPQ
jgi:hypothetical protein